MITAIATAIASDTTARIVSTSNQPRGDFSVGAVLGSIGGYGAWFGQWAPSAWGPPALGNGVPTPYPGGTGV
ncbi:MAG: hypothetical protein GX454_03360 [Brooklawnia sp.]|nr:hypothetical protein [Brooklawnia sp.]